VDVAEAVNKAVNAARKAMIHSSFGYETIPHQVKLKYASSRIILLSCPPRVPVLFAGARCAAFWILPELRIFFQRCWLFQQGKQR